MQTKIKFLVALIAISTLTFYKCDCPQASSPKKAAMFMGNANHENKFTSADVRNNPEIKWKVKTDGAVLSSPVISDKTIYIGSNDMHLYAVDAETGYVKWKFKTNGEIASTPAVTKDRIMFLSYDGYFYALNRDGKQEWKFKTEGENKHQVKDYYDNEKFGSDFWDFFLSSPVVKKNKVYFGSSDQHIYALDIETGEQVWKYKTKGSVHSSPAIYKDDLFVGDWYGRVYSINTKSGKENWSYTTQRDTTYYVWLGVQASPSVKDGVVFVGSRDALVYAFDSNTGDTLWTQDDFGRSWMPSSFAIGENKIYSGSSDGFRLYAMNKENGDIDYKSLTNSYTFSTPAITNNMAYIGSANGRLQGFDLKNGIKRWEFKTIGCQTDTIGLHDEKGIFHREKGMEMYKANADMAELSKAYHEAFVSNGAIVSSPIIHKQVIYFGSYDGYIYAITDKK